MAIGAAATAVRFVLRSSTVRTAAAKLASQPKSARSSPFRLPSGTQPLAHRVFRSPVETSACLVSIRPFHSATASALMTSLLTASRSGLCWLPEEFEGKLYVGDESAVGVGEYPKKTFLCFPVQSRNILKLTLGSCCIFPGVQGI